MGSVVVAIAMVSAAALGSHLRPTHRLADQKTKIDLEAQIPLSFGDWRVDNRSLPVLPDPEVQARLNSLYSSTLARGYVNSQGKRVMLSIAYGSDQGSEATAVHRPEFCYAAQGFNVTKLRDDTLEVDDRKIPVRRILGVMPQRVEPITYWVTLDETVTLPGIGRKYAQMQYGLKGQIPDGLLFRVSSIGPDERKEFEIQDQFLRELALQVTPEIRPRYFGR